MRVAPSRAKKDKSFAQQMDEGFGAHRFRRRSNALTEASDVGSPADSRPAPKPPRGRVSKQPLITISQSPDKAAAEAGLERWKLAHAEAAQHLAVDDVLVDRMRGASYVWYRIRVNLRHVPEELRPAQGTPDPDEDPTRAWREGHATGRDAETPRRTPGKNQ